MIFFQEFTVLIWILDLISVLKILDQFGNYEMLLENESFKIYILAMPMAQIICCKSIKNDEKS